MGRAAFKWTDFCSFFDASLLEASSMRHEPDSRPPLERAKHYRLRAEELRTIASEWMDSGTREVLMRVAKDYEDMARQLEKQDRITQTTPG